MFGKKSNQDRVDEYKHWYHTFEVLPGAVSKGEYQLEPTADYLKKWFGITDIKGKTILDVATFDGGFAWGFEDLGAKVFAIDLIDQTHTGFSHAKALRKSPMGFENISVYDLDPKRHGPFDLVHFSGIHYHLKHPIQALELINAVLKPGGVLFGNGASGEYFFREKLSKGLDEEKVHQFLKELPIAYYADGSYNGDPTNWVLYSDAGYRTSLVRAGFKPEIVKSYTMDAKTSRSTCYFKAIKEKAPDPEYWTDNHKLLAK